MLIAGGYVKGVPLKRIYSLGELVFQAANIPSSVEDLMAVPGDGEVFLDWTAPADGGSPITNYTVFYRQVGETEWVEFGSGTGTVTEVMVTGLENDVEYEFQVFAVNAVGVSAGSNVASATPVPPETLSLDPVLSGTALTKGCHAWCFDRVVDGYIGNTVRLKRLSDNAEEDFGFNEQGFFNFSDVNAWRTGADVDVVRFYDQVNSVNLVASGTVAFIRSNAVKRFGVSWNVADETLSRLADEGGLGCDMASAGALSTSSTTSIPLSVSGMEVFMLYAMNTRKVKQPGSDEWGGNNTNENLISYGTGNNNRYRHHFSGSFGTFSSAITAPDGASNNQIGGRPEIFKANAQQILNVRLNATGYKADQGYLGQAQNAWTGNNVTNVANGVLDNGIFVVAADFSNSSGAISTSDRGNFLFGGAVITQELVAAERYSVISRLGAVGQQHRLKSANDILDYFDEIILMGNTNPSTGVVDGENGLTSLQFNTGTVSEGTSTYDLENNDSFLGLRCVNNPSGNNFANGFSATNNYFSEVRTGTVLSFHRLDNTSNTMSNTLASTFCMKTGSQYAQSQEDKSLALGFDHANPSFWTKVQDSLDASDITGNRKAYPSAQAGDPFDSREYVSIGDNAGAEGGNQANGKYNRNTTHALFNFTKTFTLTFPVTGAIEQSWDKPRWANEDDTADIYCDAPTGSHVPQNISFMAEARYIPLLQIATFEEPEGYDHNAGYNANRDVILNAHNKSYVIPVGETAGMWVGDTAINEHGSVVLNSSAARIKSDMFQKSFQGSLFMFAFTENVLTQQQVEEVAVNLYKLLEA